MVAVPFDYVAADSYAGAAGCLAAHGDEAKILAGGQSLLPMLNLRLARPAVLVDINGADRRQPTVADGLLRLPATTRHRTLTEHPLVRRHCPLLAAAVTHVGNVRVRNRGTVGGSLAHADPTSEIGACALVLGGQVTALGPAGERSIGVDELFVTYLTTSLAGPEIITDVLLPVTAGRTGWSFQEMARRAADFAVVAVAAVAELDDAGTVAAVRAALAGVADRVVLTPPETLAPLVGTVPGEKEYAAAGAAMAQGVDPPSDTHASSAYRRRLVRVLGGRAVREACTRAAGVAA